MYEDQGAKKTDVDMVELERCFFAYGHFVRWSGYLYSYQFRKNVARGFFSFDGKGGVAAFFRV